MSKKLYISIIVVMFLSAAGTLVAAQQAAEVAEDELLKMIPAESVFCVRVNNPDKTLAAVDQFLMGLSPMPMVVSATVRGQLAQILGSPELKGLDMSGSLAMYGVMKEGEKPGEEMISALITVSDYELFTSGNPNVGKADANGVSQIGKNYPMALAVKAGKYALIKPSNAYQRIVDEAKTMSAREVGLAAGLEKGDAAAAAQKPIWAYGNIETVNKLFGPLVLTKIAEMKETIGAKPEMKEMAGVMDMYAAILQTLLKETKWISIAMEPRADSLTLTKTITAVSGTDMAETLAGDITKSENSLMGYMKDGAVMNMALRPNSPAARKINVAAWNLMSKMAGGVGGEDRARLNAMMTDMFDALGSSAAVSMSADATAKPPFKAVYVVEVKDSDKLNKVLEQSGDILQTSGIKKFYSSLGVSMDFAVKRAIDSYKDVSIDSAKLSFKPIDPNSQMGQMLTAMYGEGFEYRWATIENLFVCAVGGDVDAGIHNLIDEVKAGGAKQVREEMKAAMALIPGAEKSEVMGTYNYVRLAGMMPAMMPMGMPMPVVNVESKSNIAFAGKVGGGRAVIDVAVPKQHITEIVTLFKQMMQQMQPQTMPLPDEPVSQ